MDWDAPAVLLDVRPYGEGDAVATVMTEAHGAHRGLARGAQARAHRATWQTGNLVQARWVARLSDQLGSLSAELIHPSAALAMDDPLALAILTSACAVAEGALPEREPHARCFHALVSLLGRLSGEPDSLARYVAWEALLLAELGYGMDLSACAVTGDSNVAFVSPRTGRAVSEAGAGVWRERLLRLPAFLRDEIASATAEALRGGLTLTAHFLARDAFGHQHKDLPPARHRLYERVAAMADSENTTHG